MNKGVLQSSPVQQMAGGSPNWWNINNMRPLPPPPSSFFPPSAPPPPPPPPPPPTSSWSNNQELQESWGQLLLGGLVEEEENKCDRMSDIQTNKLEKWEEQVLHHHSTSDDHHVINNNYNLYSQPKADWSTTQMIMPVSSPNSCLTTLSSNMLDFSAISDQPRHIPPDHSTECNSRATTGGVAKKARVNPPSNQSTFKVRKEKLGDRITSLHQIVSPFGKTDTASVLLEAIGYIRFLQTQIEALSLPYLDSGSGNMRPHQPAAQSETINCLFPKDPGQLLNDNLMNKKGHSSEKGSHEGPKKDLRSRGLCLVPVSCTLQVGSDNGADYWAPSAFNG